MLTPASVRRYREENSSAPGSQHCLEAAVLAQLGLSTAVPAGQCRTGHGHRPLVGLVCSAA